MVTKNMVIKTMLVKTRLQSPAKFTGGPGLFLLVSLTLLGLWACGGSATSTPRAPDVLTPVPTLEQPATPAARQPTSQLTGQPETVTAAEVPTGSTRSGPPRLVPILDRTLHTVPLMDILFDTFGGQPRFVPLDLAADDIIVNLRDVIRPIDNPVYGPATALPWLEDDNLVIGYRSENGAYAYPVNILDLHEIVNDNLDGVPVLITYCPLCSSGVVFSREVGDDILTFGNTSALYMSDLVMYDTLTGSFWFQVRGEAIVGALSGSRLKLLASTTITWGEWKKLFPESHVLTGMNEDPAMFAEILYGRGVSTGFQERINNADFVFPVDPRKLDDRLKYGELVLTVEIDDAVIAFPLGLIGDGVVNHQVAGAPVVVFARSDGSAEAAFSRNLNSQLLTFEFQEEGQQFVDQETGSVWDALGRGVSGPLAGEELEQLKTRRSFWFSVAIAFPDVDIFFP